MDIRRFLKSTKTPSPSTNSSTCAVPEPDPQVSAPIDVENASERGDAEEEVVADLDLVNNIQQQISQSESKSLVDITEI